MASCKKDKYKDKGDNEEKTADDSDNDDNGRLRFTHLGLGTRIVNTWTVVTNQTTSMGGAKWVGGLIA